MRWRFAAKGGVIASLLAPMVVLLVVWLPEIRHFAVARGDITDQMVEVARATPPDPVLTELQSFYLLPYEHRNPTVVVKVAEKILAGRLELPDLPAGKITLPFSAQDLDQITPGLRVWYAGYVVPDFLLAAYVQTHREEFFSAARDFMTDWIEYEGQAWLPRGLLWNDHAIAARVRVLGEFWRLYRHRPDYKAEIGRAVLQTAARYRQMLSNPSHFTFSTNHGVMQNLALLQLQLAFPSVMEGSQNQRLALERLDKQLGFFIDEGGVIRENSAGYQAFGLEMLAMTFRCMTLLGVSVPEEWSQRYKRGLAFLTLLKRPDGTLPVFGDTYGSTSWAWFPRVTDIDPEGRSGVLQIPPPSKPDQALSLHPGAGYSIEWDGLEKWPDPEHLSQTLVAWTRPPGPGHKHADELSVLVWANGVSWLTGVGYWPDNLPGRAEAESWQAANAPHLLGEPADSSRTARLLLMGETAHLSALDLERRGPDGYVARRQVVRIRPDLWVIVDHVRGDATKKNETVWTLSPDVRVEIKDAPGPYAVLTSKSGVSATLSFLGSDGTVIHDYRGSRAPFAGWQVVRGVPQPAPAILVQQPAGDAWLAIILSTRGAAPPHSFTGRRLKMAKANTADHWTLSLPIISEQFEIRREGHEIMVVRNQIGKRTREKLQLISPPSGEHEYKVVRAAFNNLAHEYPRFLDLTTSRVKATGFLALLLVAQELFFWLVRRAAPAYYNALRVLSVICWIGVGGWLHFFRLRSWAIIIG